ncbi:MAG TPA: 50S ribosomal protein L11 methyltransferase [Vicinamibacterales bacterium]|nr:50S ribosomal protein L11 methyltransferase [Vicinamibacterales bacterium]
MNDSVRTWPALDIHPVSELLQAALVDYDASAVDERSADDWRVFFTSPSERDRAVAALRIEFPDATIEAIDVPDEDWAARSQASLRAVRVGNIVVAPPWDVPAGPVVIIIQPSMGFGTGHHATTRLCIDALQRLNIAGRTVLDVGTGSGVLAIAASLLGASRSVGIDDDADAITAAHENLQLNPQAEATLLVADLRATDVGSADVVTANLTGGLLISAARALQDLVARGGSLVLSGLMAVEETDVLAAFPTWTLEHRSEEDEWLCIVLKNASVRS